MWKAITYVGSGLSLAAFVVAVAAWTYRRKIFERERLIRLAPEIDRAKLVENTLEFFSIDTSSLTKHQKYDLVIKQIHARASRFRTSAIVVVVIACLASTVTLVALSKSPGETAQHDGNGSKVTPSNEETTYLRGQVDDVNEMPIANATVKVDEIVGKGLLQNTTTSDGSFVIEKIPAKIGDRVRVYASKEGYETDNVYVVLPGPVRFNLKKR